MNLMFSSMNLILERSTMNSAGNAKIIYVGA